MQESQYIIRFHPSPFGVEIDKELAVARITKMFSYKGM